MALGCVGWLGVVGLVLAMVGLVMLGEVSCLVVWLACVGL